MFKSIRKFLKPRKNLRIFIDVVGVIIIWRGIWGIFDIFVFPNNPILSYLSSIIFGFVLLLIDGNGLDDLKQFFGIFINYLLCFFKAFSPNFSYLFINIFYICRFICFSTKGYRCQIWAISFQD